jgi:hypothetical protein
MNCLVGKHNNGLTGCSPLSFQIKLGISRVDSLISTLILMCGMLFLGSDSVRSQIQFRRHTIHSNLASAYWVYAIDVDSDRDLDLVTASQNGVDWWSNASGDFTKKVVGPLRGAWGAHAADVDLDGDVDVMGAASGDDEFAFWEQKNGSFIQTSLGAALGPESIHAGDLDGDGDLDLIGAAWSEDQIIWWEHDGDGGFTRRILDGQLNNAHSVFSADIDGDRDTDAIAAGVGGTYWYRNDGNGSFKRREIHNKGGWSVYAADLDNDGDNDILRTQRDNGDVVLFENDGTGKFSSKVIENGFGECWSIMGGDVDGDGRLDIAGAGMAANQLRVWRNLGNGRFDQGIVVDDVSEPRAVMIADLDNDGDGDVAAAIRGDRDLAWYEVTGSPPEDKSVEITFPNGGDHLVVGGIASITWQSSSNVGSLSLEYSPDDGSTWLPIIGNTPNDGRYEWLVPSISTALARVRASEVSSPTITDLSDAPFTIAASEPQPPLSSVHETIVISDPLANTALGQRNGGQFVADGGWQVTGSEDMILYDLGRYIESGSFEIELRNFNPQNQNALARHHVMSMFRNPWGNHNPAEDPETVWDFHTGFRYDPGIKLLSWALDQDESSTKVGDAWDEEATYQIKIVWDGKGLQYFRDGVLQVTHTHSNPMQLRYLFLGRDFTVGGDLVTGFKNNQYPSMIGPIYSNLVVKEFLTGSDQSPPLLQASQPEELYANGVRLRWTMNEPAVSYLEYGLTNAYGQRTVVLGTPETETSTTLSDLLANTNYHYRIVAVDDAGNKTVGPDQTFRTLADRVYVFKPTADTFVEAAGVFNDERDHANFGWMSLLTSRQREAYLRFRVSGLSSAVSEAHLRLHARQGGDSEIIVQRMTPIWSESDVTWRTKPDVFEDLLGVVGPVAADDWAQIGVNSAITGEGNLDFALIGNNSELVSFDSRESPNDQPELVVFTGQVGQAPQIFSFSPMAGVVGTEITINGSHFKDAFQVAFGGVSTSSFSVESDNLILARVPVGSTTGRLSVTTLEGAGASATDFEVTGGNDPVTSIFIPTDDSYVRSSRPTEGNGSATDLRVRTSSADRHAYLKFKLKDLSKPIRSAVLRLYVLDGSEEGGRIHVVSNKLSGESESWNEETLTWENAPEIDGAALYDFGSVKAGKYVEIDLASLITADGTCSFGVKNRSSDLASYSSKEGSTSPELIVVSGGQVFPTPELTSFSPASGLVGDEITIFGDNLDETTSVAFDGVDASVFSSHSNNELRVVVPATASTGPLTITNSYGSATSSSDFQVFVLPEIISFAPSFGPRGIEVTLTGENLDKVSGVLFNGTPAIDFSAESTTILRAAVPAGATTGAITLATPSGSTESQSEFTVIEDTAGEARVLNFIPTDDSFVRSTRASKNYGDDDELRVRRSSSTEYYSYMKFHVEGLESAPFRAILRLSVIDGGSEGGSFYVVSNTFMGASSQWTEDELTWENAPDLPNNSIHTLGGVTVGEVVEVDVTSIISGNGIYSLAMNNASSDAVKYSSKEGSTPPELVVYTARDEQPSPPLPSITGFAPTTGTVGSEVTITGENLTTASDVLFNDTRALVFEVDSDAQVRAIVPESAASGPILLQTESGSVATSDGFQVLVPSVNLVLTGFSPSEGPVGTQVTFTGENLGEVTEVLFNGAAAADLEVDSDSQLRATVPEGATTGLIRINAGERSATSESAFQVEVLSWPVISGLSPSSGPIGADVAISGINFDDVNEILFDATPARVFSVVSSTRILVQVPVGAISGNVSVVSADGVGSSEQSFTVTAIVTGPQTITPSDDAFVRSNEPSKNYGDSPELRLRKTSSANYVTYLKFNVTGLGGPAPEAKLLITVIDPGSEGGTIYLAENNFKGSGKPWNEKDLDWENAPELIGSGFETLGPVSLGEVVEIDVASRITGNGEYTFALSHQSADATKYSSKEGSAAPVLFIGGDEEPDEEPTSTVAISSFSPTAGPIGTEVTVLGENLNATTEVLFNGTPAASFSIKSDTELRAHAPAGATTGKISLASLEGVQTSEDDFEVRTVSNTLSLTPTEDTFVRSERPTKNYKSSGELRVRKRSSGSTITFFKFVIAGLAGEVTSAKLRLFVLDASADGGALYSVSNNLRGTATAWTEGELVWSNFPTLAGPALSDVGDVAEGQTVEFDLTDAIPSDGTFSFALINDRNDVAKYSSKEGPVAPELVIETGTSSQTFSQVELAKAAPLQEEQELPERFELQQNFPNPFNIETSIEFTLPVEGRVQLVIYNMRGQTVKRLLDGRQQAGTRRISWNGTDDRGLVVGSGTYFVQLNVAEQRFIRSIILQK